MSMEYSLRQSKLEEQTYEALCDLGDEFQTEVKDYPEVRWLGRLGKFEDLGLPERYRFSVEFNQSSGGSIFLYRPNIIILNRDSPHHINEEVAHCLHLRTSKLKLHDKDKKDWFALNVLIEMFGFLGSKILDPSRKNPYSKYPDYFSVASKCKVSLEEALGSLKDLDEETLSEFLIHSQGYALGERMFYALEEGNLSRERVKKFLRKKFEKPRQATKTLERLRREFWQLNTSRI